MSAGLRNVSLNHLVCLARHWTWADQAKAQFEHQLSLGWTYEADPLADHILGAYYHWCALLCGFGEATVERQLLPLSQRAGLDADLRACLPLLRTCRDLLVAIPASREDQPRLGDLLRNGETLRRLRRVHAAFGEALREEQMSREMGFLDVHER